MHGRSCSSLLAVCLLTLCLTPAMWGQTSPISTKVAVDSLVLDQPVPAHPPSPALLGPAPVRPKPPGQFAGPRSGPNPAPGSTPTFPQLARTAGTIFAGTVTRIERGPATGGTAVPTVAITFHVERPLRGAVAGGSLTIL